jgi:DNA-binding CsgD family transcriptional regulator
LEQAAALLVEFEEGQQDKLWGGWVQAIARRCRALLASSQGKMDVAIADAEDSVKRLEQTEVPFDLARSLLVLGTVHRRSKHKRQARETLERAAQLFDDLKAVLWAQRARAELGRIGGRAATRRSLTETERRVAQLVASGHTNREVADTLFLAVKTVEWNLSRIYQKLGVRSRSELAAMLATASIAPTNTLPDRPAT